MDNSPSDRKESKEKRDERDEAILKLYDQEAARLAGFVRRRGGGPDVQDIVHDAFLALGEAWSSERVCARPQAYLYEVARNRLRRIRNRPYLEPLAAEGQEPSQRNEEDAGRLDPGTAVAMAVAKLPPRQREAVELYYVQDRSVADVAKSMQVKVGTVKALLSQARARLTESLGVDLEGGQTSEP